MRTGKINQSIDGILNAGNWQLLKQHTIAPLHADADQFTVLCLQDNDISNDTISKDAITAYGTAALSSAQYKWATIGTSFFFDGNSDYLTLPDSNSYSFGSGDFTIDFWVRFTSLSGTQPIIQQYADSNNRWYLLKDTPANGNKLELDFWTGGVNKGHYIMSSAWSAQVDTWYHIAIVRRTTSCYIFIDGVSQTLTETTAFSTNDVGNVGSVLTIGNYPGSYYFNGYLSTLRISKGIARWTSNFSVPTAPYETGFVKLLIHGDSISDAVGNTVTANGGAAVTTAQYKFSELVRSIVFDGSGDYLTIPDSNDWALGTGNFTIDCWVRTTVSSYQCLFSQVTDGSNYMYLDFVPTSSTVSFFARDTGTTHIVVGTTTLALNTWHHVAIVRLNGVSKIYINGADVTTGDSLTTFNIPNYTGVLNIGQDGFSGSYFNGWINEFRISKGIARWTSNFTPPTEVYGGKRTYNIFSGLNGDIDQEYRLVGRLVSGATNATLYLRPNNDSGTNYGYQLLYGNSTTVAAERNMSQGAFWLYTSSSSSGEINLFEGIMHAKSGFIRTLLLKNADKIATTTVSTVSRSGQSWNNTSDNITSLVIYSGQTGGLGIGTDLFLFVRRKLGSEATDAGVKTGMLNVQGKVNTGIMQLVERYEVGTTDIYNATYDKLLVEFDGTDGATSHTAKTGQTCTFLGTAQLDTADKKFGTASLLCNSTSGITIPDSDDFVFGTGDFTVDFWIKSTDVSQNQYIFGQYYNDGNTIQYCGLFGGGIYFNHKISSVSVCSYGAVSPSPALQNNTWYHIAIVRNGSNFYIFINGVSQTLTTYTAVSTNSLDNIPSAVFSISGPYLTEAVRGWIDEFRVSKGTAKWTANFTPPTAAYGVTAKLFSNLDGDTDIIYEIRARIISGTASNNNVSGWWNGDENTSNTTGYQYIYGSNTTAGAGRSTASSGAWIQLGYHTGLGEQSMFRGLIYAKSGYVRASITERTEEISTTTITSIYSQAHVWNNTYQNIISLLVNANTNGMGVGSVIELWALRKKL